jgi:cell wall-associated protease
MTNPFSKIRCFAICGALLLSFAASAQTGLVVSPAPPKTWHQMDYKTDGYYGISLKQHTCF